MSNPKKQDSIGDDDINGIDRVGQSNGDGFEDSSSLESSSGGIEATAVGSVENSSVSRENGLTERLTDILVDEGDGDLLLQQSDRETRVLQWLQALDMQVMGACRADERLKPLLKLNVSSGAGEDRLLAHLCQHFEPSEVGMLARCLCMPLVSIRVGKIIKQGTLLCPSAIRGSLNLMLLPTSDLRISLIGDDGHTERLFTLKSNSNCSAMIEDIPADNSGRSFLIKTSDHEVFYFWCSEKSKFLGIELLTKMKDILMKKPSLAELTGISDSRLDCFATHLRAYLIGSTASKNQASGNQTVQFLPTSSKPLRSRHTGSQAAKSNSLYQGSLSPRSSSFKEGLPKSLSSLRSAVREKLRRRGDSHLSVVDIDNLPGASSIASTEASSSNHYQEEKHPEISSSHALPPSSFLDSLGKSDAFFPLSSVSQVTSLGLGSSLLSPYYCWCPPRASTLQYTVGSSQLPLSSADSLPLPPLSSLLPATRSSSLLAQMPPFSLTNVPPLDLPSLLPDSLVRLPYSMQNSQQIPTFTSLMCDPIVHIPVIDVCSSGQGYFVSAGPAISTTIQPLHPNFVNPLMPETNSAVENGARETLRLLMSGSNQTNPPLINVLPTVLTSSDEKQGLLVAGSRGLYSGTRDVDAIANSIAALGLVSLSGRSIEDRAVKKCGPIDLLDNQPNSPHGLDDSCANDVGYDSSNLGDERTD